MKTKAVLRDLLHAMILRLNSLRGQHVSIKRGERREETQECRTMWSNSAKVPISHAELMVLALNKVLVLSVLPFSVPLCHSYNAFSVRIFFFLLQIQQKMSGKAGKD